MVTAEIWVVRSESSLFPFWTWSGMTTVEEYKDPGRCDKLKSCRLGTEEHLYGCDSSGKLFICFFFQVACNSVKMLSVAGFSNVVEHFSHHVHEGYLASALYFTLSSCPVLVSGLYWSHKMSWHSYSTSVMKRFIRYLLFLLFMYLTRIYHRSHVWLAFSLLGQFLNCKFNFLNKYAAVQFSISTCVSW